LLNEPFLCFYTPGHTKGSICIQYQNRLFSGDTLFADSIGRTDLYSGNMNDMKQSLRLLSERLSNQTVVYPGHGESKKWQEIKEVNPYLK
jgi:hydroxyacylglutathione hydrolase